MILSTSKIIRKLALVLIIFLSTVSFSQENKNNTCKSKPFKAFITDKDAFSNIRATPNGQIVLKINAEYLYGCVVNIIDFKDGWFKINEVNGVDGYKVSEFEGWLHSSIVGAATTHDLDVMDTPNGKIKVGKLIGENGDTFKITAMYCEWIQIKYKELVGWVKSEDICGNPVSTCP